MLPLGVAPPDARQGGKQKSSLQAVGAAVDLAHGLLAWRGIPLFDDADDVALIVPQNTAVTRRIVQVRRQHRESRLLPPVRIKQAVQGCRAQQRHVAAQDQHVAVEVSQHGFRLRDRVPGAQLRLLHHAARAEAFAHTLHGIGLVAHHRDEMLGGQGLHGRQDVRDERTASQWM